MLNKTARYTIQYMVKMPDNFDSSESQPEETIQQEKNRNSNEES